MKRIDLKKHKRQILIIIFMAILVFPWVAGGVVYVISPDYYQSMTESTRENRDMSSIEVSNLWNTGESISEFVDDRVPFRDHFIKLYQNIDGTITSVYQTAAQSIISAFYEPKEENSETADIEESEDADEAVEESTEPEGITYMVPIIKGQTVEGREGWLFLASENELDYYCGTNLPTEEEMANYASIVNQLNTLCQAQGKELYLMITPNKSQVYDRYMPSFEIATRYKRVQMLYDYIQENAGLTMVYPLTELYNVSLSTQDYYKYDTHWNMVGAYIGVQALYQQMGIETYPLETWSGQWQQTDEMDLCDLGFIDRDSVEPDSDYIFDYKPDIAVTGLDLDAMVDRTQSNCGNGKHLVMVSDSYRVNMMPIITKDFSYCTIAHRDYLESVEQDIKDADIIVVSMVERYDTEAFNVMSDMILMLQ